MRNCNRGRTHLPVIGVATFVRRTHLGEVRVLFFRVHVLSNRHLFGYSSLFTLINLTLFEVRILSHLVCFGTVTLI